MISDSKLARIEDLRDLPLVEIRWRDAATTSGWDTKEFVRSNDGLVPIRTVGWIAKQTRKEVIMAQSISRFGRMGDRITIPRAQITHIRRLSKGRRDD